MQGMPQKSCREEPAAGRSEEKRLSPAAARCPSAPVCCVQPVTGLGGSKVRR